MQIIRAPFDLNVPFTLKRVDPSLADVAVRSNKVAVNSKFRAHLALRKQDGCIAPKDSTPPDSPLHSTVLRLILSVN
jgi:hypothetical protein